MTGPGALVIEPLIKRHNRAAFLAGFRRWTTIWRAGPGRTFDGASPGYSSAPPGGANAVLGFYTLSALSIDLTSLPERLSRKLPRHPVPCALIGWLAVDRSAQGHGLGCMLLADAIKRVVGAGDSVAIHALIVDAKNDEAKPFYEGFGFTPLRDNPMRLFLPLGSVALRGSNE